MVSIGLSVYDSLNGRIITPIRTAAGKGVYICTVEEITENGDLSFEGTQLFTEYELKRFRK